MVLPNLKPSIGATWAQIDLDLGVMWHRFMFSLVAMLPKT
jgi:hypothetical protein